MKQISCTVALIMILPILLGSSSITEENVDPIPKKIRVLLITGGHGFAREPFFAMWKSLPGIEFHHVEHPNAHALLKPEAAKAYDVIVLYDMWQPISEQARVDFINLLKQGKGLVALHHSLCGYQEWDEYARIIGGRYHMKKRVENGIEKPASGYQHDVRFMVRIADRNHPITRGMKDFEIFDETYSNFEVLPYVKPLLTTDEPTSTKTIGWAHTYPSSTEAKKSGMPGSRVVYLQLGHGPAAYENQNYRRLVVQAVRWVAAPKLCRLWQPQITQRNTDKDPIRTVLQLGHSSVASASSVVALD